MRRIFQKWVIAILLVVVTAWAYRGVGECEFVGFDDDLYVYENPQVRAGLSISGVRWAFTAVHASTWQPMVWLSYMSDAQRHGDCPGGYHLTNLLLHVASVLLLFLAWSALTGSCWRSALVAALVAIHPVHVESVAWVAERKDVLCAVFWWGAILAYAGYVRAGTLWRGGGVVLLFCLALMSKPMALTLPAALLLLDVWPLKRFRGNVKRCLVEKLILLPLSVVSLALTYHVQAVGGSVLGVEVISLWGRASNAVVSLGRYVGKLVWPRSLALLYPHPGGWGVWITLAVLLALVCVGVVAWRLRHRCPSLPFGLCWFVGTLLPVLGLIQIGWHAMADRFLYIPAVGLYVAVAWCLPIGLTGVRRGFLLGSLCAWLLLLGVRTTRQVALWRDNVTLFSHAVEVTRDNWVMENCLGAALVRVGAVEQALPHLGRAIAVKPDRPKAYYNLGCALMALHRPAEAAVQFEQAVARWPGHLKTTYNLAAALAASGQRAEALATYEALLQEAPEHIQAMNNVAGLYRADGQLDEAIAQLRKALAIAPHYTSARYNLGVFLLESGHTTESAQVFAELLRDEPGHVDAKVGLRAALDNFRARQKIHE
jgi:Flp pilus assembly protein TadD